MNRWLALRCQSEFVETTTPTEQPPVTETKESKSNDGAWGDDSSWTTESSEDQDLEALLKMRDMSLSTASTDTSKKQAKKDVKKTSEVPVEFIPYWIEVDNEPSDYSATSKKENSLLKKYEADAESKGESWGKEKYEDTEKDKIFAKFQKRLDRSREQCLRWD